MARSPSRRPAAAVLVLWLRRTDTCSAWPRERHRGALGVHLFAERGELRAGTRLGAGAIELLLRAEPSFIMRCARSRARRRSELGLRRGLLGLGGRQGGLRLPI